VRRALELAPESTIIGIAMVARFEQRSIRDFRFSILQLFEH
jgi:hypothetical protein